MVISCIYVLLSPQKKTAEMYTEIKRAAVLASDSDIHRYSAFKANFIEHYFRLALMDSE